MSSKNLSQILSKRVVDIKGYVSDPFDVGPTFILRYVVFEDGTELDVAGEHDIAFLYSDDTESLVPGGLARFMED